MKRLKVAITRNNGDSEKKLVREFDRFKGANDLSFDACVAADKDEMIKFLDQGADIGISSGSLEIAELLRNAQIHNAANESILINGITERKLIPLRRIVFFEIRGHIVYVTYEVGQNRFDTFSFPGSLMRLESKLAQKGFFRIQRSYLVNVNHVESCKYSEAIMSDNTRISIGRQKYRQLLQMLESCSN